MSVQTFLDGLEATLEADLGIEVEQREAGEGPLELPGDSRGHGFLWPDSTEEVEGDVYHEHVNVMLRIFLPAEQEFDLTDPSDTVVAGPLVALRQQVIDSLRPHQDHEFGVHFFRVQRVGFDHRARRLDAEIVGRQFADFQKPVGE